VRTYEETHPWITFQLDLTEINYWGWMLLGEAQSKCEHLSGVLLVPGAAERLNEFQEVDNVVEACNLIGKRIISGSPTEPDVETIKEYNALVLKDLPLDEDVIPGQIREHNVRVGSYLGAPPEDCEYLLKRLCAWLNSSDFSASKEDQKVAYVILKAIIAHIYIAWIHPFGDGNGRTARLIELQILLSAGIPSPAAHLLSNHYNKTRTEYYRQLDRTHKSGGDVIPFVEYALQGFVDGLREQLEIIEIQHFTVHWTNHIHNSFKGKNGKTDERQRRLMLDLAQQVEPLLVPKVRHLTPQITEAYANLTDRTLGRDLRELEEMDLLIRTHDGFRANLDVMRAFLSTIR